MAKIAGRDGNLLLNVGPAPDGKIDSAQVARLREIGEEAGVPSYLLADGSELNAEWVKGAKVIGLTAGASAPEAMVQDVIESLRTLGPIEVTNLPGVQENVEFRLPAELHSV